jgi:prephenate dehydratase
MVKNMNKEIIGVSGNKGSFSEEAGIYYCHKNNIKEYELKYLTSVENVLSSLEKEEISLGIFPIENSNGGIVYEAVHAMSNHLFDIQNFFEIDIKHNLITLPENELEDIKLIASHSQALKQCKMYLKRKWPEAKLEEWSDTAGAVKAIKEGDLPKYSAAIASNRAAKIYDMKIVEEGVQDLKFNFTTFLAVRKKEKKA